MAEFNKSNVDGLIHTVNHKYQNIQKYLSSIKSLRKQTKS